MTQYRTTHRPNPRVERRGLPEPDAVETQAREPQARGVLLGGRDMLGS